MAGSAFGVRGGIGGAFDSGRFRFGLSVGRGRLRRSWPLLLFFDAVEGCQLTTKRSRPVAFKKNVNATKPLAVSLLLIFIYQLPPCLRKLRDTRKTGGKQAPPDERRDGQSAQGAGQFRDEAIATTVAGGGTERRP